MQIKGVNGFTLFIEANTEDDTLNFSMDGSSVVKLNMAQLARSIPSLQQVYAALQESAKNKLKLRRDEIVQQIDALQQELAAIPKD